MAALAEWVDVVPTDLSTLTKPITYVMGAEGVMQIRKLPFGLLIEKATQFLVPPPTPRHAIPQGLRLGVPKVPWELYCRIVAFFREVYKVHNSEVLIQLFYDPEDNAWIPHVPEQHVSGGSVKHNGLANNQTTLATGGVEGDPNLIHAIDIHSHCDFGAFFSGTDDADEKRATRMYGVIGNLKNALPSTNWRMWTGYEFKDLAIDEIINLPTGSVPAEVSVASLLRIKTGSANMRFSIDLPDQNPFDQITDFPDHWMKAVKALKVTVIGGGGVGHSGFPRPGGGHGVVESVRDGVTTGPGSGVDLKPFVRKMAPLSEAVTAASEYARANPAKNVYLIHSLNGQVWRVESDGSRRLTGLTVKDLARQQHSRAGTASKIEAFAATSAD